MFQHVDMYAGDPILSLVDTFKKDPRANKVNLGIGIYYDDAGNIPVLPSVQQAETDIAQAVIPRAYLPMEGSPAYRAAIQHLLFGENNAVLKAGRVASIQSLGGSGALKVGADFLHKYFRQVRCGLAIRLGTTTTRFSRVLESKPTPTLIMMKLLVALNLMHYWNHSNHCRNKALF